MPLSSLPLIGALFARVPAREPMPEAAVPDGGILEALLQASPMALFALDRSGRVERFWNPRAQAAFGRSPSEALGNPLPIVLPGFEEELARVLARVFDGEPVADLAGQGVLEDGPSFPLRLSLSPILGRDGQVESALVACGEEPPQESRLAALAGLLGEKAQVLDAVRTAGVVVWAMQPQGRRMRHVSSAVKEVLGLDREALLANAEVLFEGLDAGGRQLFEQARSQAWAGGVGSFEAPFAHPGKGRSVWTRWTLDLGGGLLRGVVQDVTEAQDLRQQLVHSQKLETVGEFLSGVTHDFNNILLSILGCNELLLTDPALSPDQKRRLEVMRKGVDRGHALAGKLLRFVRREPSVLRRTDLNELAREAILLLADPKAADLEFRLELDEALPEVLGEPTELYQVIMNLLINARDAMPSGGRITLRTSQASGLGGMAKAVLLEIQDTGPGIAPGVKERIFEPFFTTKPPGEGTGLGLALAHRIITAHGGVIQCLNPKERGALFQILLPLGEERVSA
jgi:hypothetical protein